MTARARIKVVEELKVDMPSGRMEATIVNGETKDFRITLSNGASLLLWKQGQLAELHRAIENMLGLIGRAQVRFEWDEVAYIEEGGVRVV